MSYLLFLDESGHDHTHMPYEIHGGIALHATKLWPFIQAFRNLEQTCFGASLSAFGSEIKGEKLLKAARFKFAAQAGPMDPVVRRKHALRFLDDGAQGLSPMRDSFTAYGQASIEMVHGIFALLSGHQAKIFAVAIPAGARSPAGYQNEEFLRKDLVFLFERYFRFLEEENETGLLVMDETDIAFDRKLVKRIESYFEKTKTGRWRSSRIVPSPLFVSSEMTYPVQAADVCIYCLNWGFRIPARGMNAPVRPEIAEDFAGYLGSLQHRTVLQLPEGGQVPAFSIAYVSDPYTARAEN
jgi:hypothetical protein